MGTCKMNASPSSTSLGNIPKDYSALPNVASEEKDKLNKGLNGGVALSQFGMPSGLPLVHLHPASGAEAGETS